MRADNSLRWDSFSLAHFRLELRGWLSFDNSIVSRTVATVRSSWRTYLLVTSAYYQCSAGFFPQ